MIRKLNQRNHTANDESDSKDAKASFSLFFKEVSIKNCSNRFLMQDSIFFSIEGRCDW